MNILGKNSPFFPTLFFLIPYDSNYSRSLGWQAIKSVLRLWVAPEGAIDVSLLLEPPISQRQCACRPIGHRLMQVLFPHLAYITLFLLFSSVKLPTLCNGTKESQLPVASTFFLTN